MNRDELAALARGTVAVAAGAALLVGLGLVAGWWAVGALSITLIGAAAWDAWRRPGWWRMW